MQHDYRETFGTLIQNFMGVNDEVVNATFFNNTTDSSFTDIKIQNLINAYLSNPPIVQYENIPFPHLPEYKVVGLVTIRPKKDFSVTSLRKNIWKYYGGAVFMRKGSMSMPQNFDIEIKNTNSKIVQEIENHAKNNIEYTLSGVLDFMKTNIKGDLSDFQQSADVQLIIETLYQSNKEQSKVVNISKVK